MTATPRTSCLRSTRRASAPSGHLLGTDQLGRDIFARMISGARVSLLIAISVVVVSGVVGTLLGAISGYWGGTRDVVLQKIVETFWAFPPILLALTIMAFFGQSLTNIVIAIAMQRWIPYCRIARAQSLVLSTKDFVAASRIMGGGTAWIVGGISCPTSCPPRSSSPPSRWRPRSSPRPA